MKRCINTQIGNNLILLTPLKLQRVTCGNLEILVQNKIFVLNKKEIKSVFHCHVLLSYVSSFKALAHREIVEIYFKILT